MDLTTTEARMIQISRRLPEEHREIVAAYLEELFNAHAIPVAIKAPALRLVVSNDSPIPLTDPRIAELRALLAQAKPRSKGRKGRK